jgi:hypothetical protein
LFNFLPVSPSDVGRVYEIEWPSSRLEAFLTRHPVPGVTRTSLRTSSDDPSLSVDEHGADIIEAMRPSGPNEFAAWLEMSILPTSNTTTLMRADAFVFWVPN